MNRCRCGHEHIGRCMTDGCRCVGFRKPKAAGGMRAKPKKPLLDAAANQIVRGQREAWARAARSKPCAVCGKERPAVIVRGHHVLRQQVLKAICHDAGMDEHETNSVLWDHRNLMPLCDRCHGDHHAGSRRVSQRVVSRCTPRVAQLARELDRLFLDGRKPAAAALEREYE